MIRIPSESSISRRLSEKGAERLVDRCLERVSPLFQIASQDFSVGH